MFATFCVIVCLVLGDLSSEQQQFVGYQDQTYEDSDLFFCEQEASILEHIAPIYPPIYSVIVVLHACVYESTPMIGLNRVVLSFDEALA
jgi:hypothetical protein